MNLEQIRNILITGSYLNWEGDNYAKFINYLGSIDIHQLDLDAYNIAISILEKESSLITTSDTVKIKLPTREEQNKALPKLKESEVKVIIISIALVSLTIYFLILGII